MRNMLMMAASGMTDPEIVSRELHDGSTEVNSGDCDGWTPLHLAAALGHARVVRTLLAHGADSMAPNHQGATPLHLAVLLDRAESVAALLEGGGLALLDCRDRTGWTPLDYAAMDPLSEAAEVLRRLNESGTGSAEPASRSTATVGIAL